MARRSVVPLYVRAPARTSFGLVAPAWTAVMVVGSLLTVELYARSGAIGSLDLVPVTEMIGRAFEMLGDRRFVQDDLLRTLMEIVISFLASGALGVFFAYLMTSSTWCRRAFQPYLAVFYALPIFALYPVMVVLFGTGLVPIVMLSTLFSVVVVTSNSMVGFASVPAIVQKLSTSLKMSRAQHIKLILLPAALPDILAGLKLGLAYSVIAVLATEFILSTQGLGHAVATAYNTFNTVDMYAGILFISAFALIANLALGTALSRFDWRRR
ncbi:MAG: ABC transporter permease [Rhodococcus sp. (in: high G+C Gram-positive bacteria)]